MDSEKIKIGIPKGSLQESTLALFARAGFAFHGAERSLWLSSNDSELSPVLLRAQEIPEYVANGKLHCGLSGHDWIVETGSQDRVHVLADLCYSKKTFRPVRWVLAVHTDSPFQNIDDLRALEHLTVATELTKITTDWLADKKIYGTVDFSWGATEAKVPYFADAIVECTETGLSLEMNGLRIIDTVLASTTQFIGNPELCGPGTRACQKVRGIALLLTSCLVADGKVSVRAVVDFGKTTAVRSLIPADVEYTVITGQNGRAIIDFVISKERARDLVPVLSESHKARVTVGLIRMFAE